MSKEKYEQAKLPMVPIRDVVIFPYMMVPFVIGRESSVLALEAVAVDAIKRNVGARGLRIILEELMLDLMYQLPQQKEHRELTITKEMVEKKEIQLPFEKAG